jgi:hypothetical protein
VTEDFVEIVEIFTRKKWFRRVGDGPLEEVDLTLYGGVVPVVFLDDKMEWVKQTKLLPGRTIWRKSS